ncbi:MAG: hypothetical protein JST00_09460 [Deltaproteobacteria bacterium]|nr:hypothetical protein [Deltaproteobacteria bacterium]
MESRTKLTLVAGVIVVGAALLFMKSSSKDGAKDVRDGAGNGSGASATSTAVSSVPRADAGWAASDPGLAGDASTNDDRAARLLLSAKWGSGDGELGRERPQEGNAEGPMSLTFAGDDLLVLDQVNGRLSRFDKDGKPKGSMRAPNTVQDIAVASDGSVAMLDRLVGKAVTLTDASGRKVGELPLGPKVSEPGLVTGVVVDGKNVYVEKEHGALVPIGTIDGQPPPSDATDLTGRPTKDGQLLVTAGITSKREGKAHVNAVDRKTMALRFARSVSFPRPSHAIVMLDSDARGTIYLGVATGEPTEANIACLDPSDGHVTGRVVVPMSHTPEESFRDFTVAADGTIAYALRTEESVEYRTARCR